MWTVALPFGVISCGLFLISFMLEKEVANFDEDEAKELQLIKDSYATSAPKKKSAAEPIMIQLPSETFGNTNNKQQIKSMKTNSLKDGASAEDSIGIGTVTRDMVQARAAELAIIDGRLSDGAAMTNFSGW